MATTPMPLSEATERFLATVMLAIVGTHRGNGAVKMSPAWYEYRDGYFWLSTRRGAHWLDHIERDRSASLLMVDPGDAHRLVHAETRLVETTSKDALEQLDRLSVRYRGEPYRLAFPQHRVTVQLEPGYVRSTVDPRLRAANGSSRRRQR
jgi:hypothetical protein